MPRLLKTKLPFLDLGNETICQRLVRFRKNSGLTQNELANKIGISRTLIADYENGRARIYSSMLARLAKALKITADELIGLKEPKNIENKPNLRLIKRLKKIEQLSVAKQKALLQIIDGFLKSEGI